MSTRRMVIVLAIAIAFAAPFNSSAQQPAPHLRRIGVLLFNSPQIDPIGPFLEGLQALGYVEGKNVTFDYAYAEGNAELLPELAVALVARKPDMIFAYGGDVAPHAKAATKSI